MDGHFRGFLQLLQEYFGFSEEDALREIELRVNLTKTKMEQKTESRKVPLNFGPSNLEEAEKELEVLRKYKRTPHPVYLDFNENTGSLLIEFGSIGEGTLESDARVLVSFSKRGLAGIEILLDSKEVVKKLSEAFRERD
ncbi:MAG: hypothetical protein DRQ24_08565 [Candidatus Latescibacterota bacterium]|nr:MAG: hypothetical protein DRQ24_08565 [Candidatus Latescibacterota bacterium]